MIEERDSDLPEWESPEPEKVPPSLQRKWKEDQKKGLRAGVCRHCGVPYIEEDLSCGHCGQPVEDNEGWAPALTRFLTSSPWGIVTAVLLILAFLSWIV